MKPACIRKGELAVQAFCFKKKKSVLAHALRHDLLLFLLLSTPPSVALYSIFFISVVRLEIIIQINLMINEVNTQSKRDSP